MNTGDVLDGRFRLLGRLGAGGMSVVWRAHDEVLGRDVAVKVLFPELAEDPGLLARVRDEARALARLRHPNVVDVYDYGEMADERGRRTPYVVMEVVEGRSLAQLLTGDALPWRVAVLLGAQVAAALAAAHECGLVHRDVKPGNVVVAGARVKLLDFGIAAASGDDDGPAGQVLGTPAYLAPERLENGVVRPATDVYALGLLLYRALAGCSPWEASTATQMLIAHRYEEPAALPRVPGLPPEVADLCRRCLDKDPERRPAAARVAEVLGVAAGLAPAALFLPDATEPPAAHVGPGATAPPAELDPTVPIRSLGRHLIPIQRLWRRTPRMGRVAVAAGGVLLLTGAAASALPGDPAEGPSLARTPAAAAGMEQPATACKVDYTVARAVNGRFITRLRVANTGTGPITAGRLTFALTSQQRLVSGTPGTWRQEGSAVSARIGDLSAGQARTATIQGTYRGLNALPDRFQLNDATCRYALSVAGATSAEKPVPPVGKKAGKAKKHDGDEDD